MDEEFIEEKQDQVTEDKLAALEDIFNSTPTYNQFDLTQKLPFGNNSDAIKVDESDMMENTSEIDSVQLSVQLNKLREIRDKLEHENLEHVSNLQGDELQGGEQPETAKVLTKKTNQGAPVVTEPMHSDIGEIIYSFIACVQLAGITALIGAAWLVNLVIHIR